MQLSCMAVAACSKHEAPPPPAPEATATATLCPELGGLDPWADRLGKHTLADRGAIVGCVHAASVSRADLEKSPFHPSTLGGAHNGYELFVVQYVTEGRPGVAATASALLYTPSGGAAGVPVVAFDHGLSGMGPTCGPTHVPLVSDPFAIPLVEQGYAVIAPDYQGMGVDNGMTSYLVGAAETAATLDAVRALRRFHDRRFDAAQLGKDLFLAGHSQGGQAALFTHQRFDPSIGVELRGTVTFAPGLGSTRGFASLFSDPRRPVGNLELAAVMTLYAHALYTGSPDPSSFLSPAAAAALPAMLHDQCIPTLVQSIPARFPTQGDLYQPSFLAKASGCTLGVPCPAFEPWTAIVAQEQPGDFASPIPALVLHGLFDFIVPAPSVACIVDRLKARGTPVQACAYAHADHTGIIGAAVPDMVRWMDARRTGQTIDVCPAPLNAVCD
ncbi:secretory lipase [Minicystis rosea]|nr:secretory lipase [Minicystis rosea]